MSMLKKMSVLFVSLSLASTSLWAQTDKKVSDDELKQFVTVAQKAQAMNQESQQEMVKAVEDKGLDVQRFNEIRQAEQDPTKEVDANAEELKKYASANASIEKIYMGVQEKIEANVKKEGLSMTRYQEIATTVQSSPELQEKIQKLIQN